MTQGYKGGLTALAWLGAIVTGCGGWVDLDTPQASGGSASGSAGTAGKPAKVGGAAGTGSEIIGRGQSGAPTDSPIAKGEGGELLTAGGADIGPDAPVLFQLLQAPPPTLLPAGVAAGTPWAGTVMINGGSLEQGALVGTSTYCFGAGAGTCADSSEPFVWTEAAGVVSLDHLDNLPGARYFYPQFVSANGDTVVGLYNTVGPNFGGFFRWTKTGGATRLGEPVGAASGGPEWMSNDGRVVAGMAKVQVPNDIEHQQFLWTATDGYQALAMKPTWPANAEIVGMSADGSLLVGQTLDLPKQVFRWSPTTGAEQIGALPGFPSCTVDRISKDAGTVFGSCQVYPDPGISFVWTHAAGIAAIKQGDDTCAMYENALSDDGAIAFGSAACGAAPRIAVRWSAATGVVALPSPVTGFPQLTQDGSNHDGSVAFGVLEPAANVFPDQIVDGASPFRWSAAAGLVALPSLSGHTLSYAYATTADGAALVGRSGTLAGGVSEAVLWDSVGVVGIAAYLTTLGADLQGAHLPTAEHVVTRDGTTIVQGISDLQNRTGAWIAWLPERH